MSDAQQSARRRLTGHPPVVLACLGLGVVVVGTFLPWLRSGTTMRNSYAGDAALRGLVDQAGLRLVLAGWPFLGLLCAAAAVLLIVGRTRVGAALAVLATLAAGLAATAALHAGTGSVVRAAVPGPVVTVAAAGATLLVSLYLIVRRRTS